MQKLYFNRSENTSFSIEQQHGIYCYHFLKVLNIQNVNVKIILPEKINEMLSDKKLKAFIPTINPAKAREFYVEILGLKLLSEDNYALEFDANGTLLRITTVEKLLPHPFTVLGWDVDNIKDLIKSLIAKGVVFERYEFIKQDNLGIWSAPGGTLVAWFKDPDGNLLSLSEL